MKGETSSGWMETFTGKRVMIVDPDPKSLNIKDVAHGLSLQCRYNGHTPNHYSVAEHSVLVASILPQELKLFGLLHDASETWLGDLAQPVKAVVGTAYTDLEDVFQHLAYQRLADSEPTGPEHVQIKEADMRVLMTEAAALMPSKRRGWAVNDLGLEPAEVAILCWEPKVAESAFLDAYRRYTLPAT